MRAFVPPCYLPLCAEMNTLGEGYFASPWAGILAGPSGIKIKNYYKKKWRILLGSVTSSEYTVGLNKKNDKYSEINLQNVEEYM